MYVQTQKYTGSRFSKLIYFFSILKIYILELDFRYWCIYFDTQTYTWSRLSKLMYLFSNFEADFWYWCIYFETLKYTWSRFSKIMNLCAKSEVYLKYTSFQKKSRSINKVLLKYKQSTFLFFSVFILHLYFFLGSSLKAYFYWTSRIWSINEVYLKYT